MCSLEGSQCLPAYTVYLLSLPEALSHTEKLYFKPSITEEGNPVMSLQKTAGAHPLICSNSCSEESESMIHPTDKETLQRTHGKIRCGGGGSNTFLERCALILKSKTSLSRKLGMFSKCSRRTSESKGTLPLPLPLLFYCFCVVLLK